MQTVALYIIGIAAITVLLFNLYGEPLVAAKLNDMADQADQFIAKGEITHEQATEYLTSIEKFYRIGVYLPVLVLTNLLVGFVSSIPAALLIKK